MGRSRRREKGREGIFRQDISIQQSVKADSGKKEKKEEEMVPSSQDKHGVRKEGIVKKRKK